MNIWNKYFRRPHHQRKSLDSAEDSDREWGGDTNNLKVDDILRAAETGAVAKTKVDIVKPTFGNITQLNQQNELDWTWKGAADKSCGCARWCKTNLFGSCQEASLSARLSALKCKEREKGGRKEHTSYNQNEPHIAIFLMCTTYVVCRLTSDLPGLSHHGCYASISFCVRACVFVC